MILLSSFRQVEYHGILLAVPEDTKYIVTELLGNVYALTEQHKGVPVAAKCYWTQGGTIEYLRTCVGKVDLEGLDWRDTLMTYETCILCGSDNCPH